MQGPQGGCGEIFFEDLTRLSPDQLQSVFEWVLEKIDSFAASWKDCQDEEDAEDSQHLNDIDLFSLTDGNQGLVAHHLWLSHLEDRVMRDGNLHKAAPGEDPSRLGLVLEWIYGSIVSTSEKARESAKRQLHTSPPPDANTAWALLRAVRFLCALYVHS
jgi:hypothetical protein